MNMDGKWYLTYIETTYGGIIPSVGIGMCLQTEQKISLKTSSNKDEAIIEGKRKYKEYDNFQDMFHDPCVIQHINTTHL